MIPAIKHDHTICQGCGSENPAVEAGGVYACPNRHCLITGAWNARRENDYQDDKGATSPAQARRWKLDALADLAEAIEGGDVKRIVVMQRSILRLVKHLGDCDSSLTDELRVLEAIRGDEDPLTQAMRSYHGDEKFVAMTDEGATPDSMAAVAMLKYAKGTNAIHEALASIGFTPEEKEGRFNGLSTLEIAAQLITLNAGAIADEERRRRMGPDEERRRIMGKI